jgi:hypothetical protein
MNRLVAKPSSATVFLREGPCSWPRVPEKSACSDLQKGPQVERVSTSRGAGGLGRRGERRDLLLQTYTQLYRDVILQEIPSPPLYARNYDPSFTTAL